MTSFIITSSNDDITPIIVTDDSVEQQTYENAKITDILNDIEVESFDIHYNDGEVVSYRLAMPLPPPREGDAYLDTLYSDKGSDLDVPQLERQSGSRLRISY